MKLRNLMYATMIACAFASCSKDDENVPGNEPGKGDAALTIQIDAKAVTKALGDNSFKPGVGLAAEDVVNELTLVVFNNEGSYLASSNVKKGNASTVLEASVADLPTGSAKFMLFANMNLTESTLRGLNATSIFTQPIATKEFTTAEGLPMTSTIQSVVLESGDNYCGYKNVEDANLPTSGRPNAKKINHQTAPISLVRNVARVDLNSLSLDLTQYTSGTASFTLKSIGMVNATAASTYANSANGSVVDGFGASAIGYLNSAAVGEFADKQDFTLPGAKTIKAPKAYFYVLANPFKNAQDWNATNLVVEGTLQLKDCVRTDDKGNTITDNLDPVTGYYPVMVGVQGLDENVDKEGVVNNHIYKISMTFAGAGRDDWKPTPGPDPDPEYKAYLFVKCAVEQWTTVNQNPDPIK